MLTCAQRNAQRRAGTPAKITEGLGQILNNVRVIISIAPFYSKVQHISVLFQKMSNQLITAAKRFAFLCRYGRSRSASTG